MKIAFVAQPFDGVLPPRQNSIGLIIYHTARQLARDAAVTVYLPQGDDGDVREQDGVTYRPVSTRVDDAVLSFAKRYPSLVDGSKLFTSGLYYLNYITRVALDLRRSGFDIIHIVNFSQFAPVVKRLNPDTRVVLEMQCEWLEQLDHRMVAKRLRSVDLITGDSEHITHGVRNAFPNLSTPCRTAYNGFDEDRFTPDGTKHAGRAPTLLFVGRVSPEKGVHLLVDALAVVVKRFPEARLVSAGARSQAPLEYLIGLSKDQALTQLAAFYDGRLSTNYQEYLDRRARELGVSRNIEFTGALPQSELPNLYGSASVLVNPSFSESFGMSLVVAMATRKPVVATRVGGMKEIVEDGRTGFL
ncbi:MAG: glycosyltransferase family 4 protein, partial [Gammaproteobacteria bacterium]